MNTLTQLHRAAANAIWPLLRSGRWRKHVESRGISPTGNPRGHTSNTSTIPGPEPTVEILTLTRYLEAAAASTETHLTYGIAINLTYVDHCAVLARVTHAAAAEYEDARRADALRTQRPFIWKGTHYRRNPVMPRRAAIVLQAIAAAATIQVLTPEQDAEVLPVHDMRPTEVHAAVQRGEGT